VQAFPVDLFSYVPCHASVSPFVYWAAPLAAHPKLHAVTLVASPIVVRAVPLMLRIMKGLAGILLADTAPVCHLDRLGHQNSPNTVPGRPQETKKPVEVSAPTGQCFLGSLGWLPGQAGSEGSHG